MDLPGPLAYALPNLLLLSVLGQVALEVVAVVVLLMLSGLISGSEVAYFSLTADDYEELEQRATPASKTVLRLRELPRRLLATILIANNSINIALVLVSDLLLQQLLPEALFRRWAAAIREASTAVRFLSEKALAGGIRFTITVVGVTFLLVLFGEVAPKVYARYNKLRLTELMARPLDFLLVAFRPLSFLLVNGARVIERRLERHTADNAIASQEEIDEAIELTVNTGSEGEDGGRQDGDLLKRIVQFGNVTVRQVMRSRGDVVAVEQKTDYASLLELVRDQSYSRIPVFEEDFDRVRGILYVKDLLGHRHEGPDFDWFQLVRPDVMYVPENKKISDLLEEFRLAKLHLAVVVDEYGGTEGIVTLEDILEEVIGNIQDEFDEGDDIHFEQIDEFNFVFDGKTLLNDVCRVVDIPTNTFDEVKGEAESFAGLILEMLGRFPEPEQEIAYPPYRFRIEALTPRRVEKILITLPSVVERPEAES